jgi:hypothetical protein
MGKRNVNVLAGEGDFLESQMHVSLMDAIAENGGVACQDDPDIFFPETGDYFEIKAAKSLCRQCPIIDLCGEYAIRFNVTDGIWGGFTPSERRRERVSATTGRPLRAKQPSSPIDPYNVSNKERQKQASNQALALLPKALEIAGDRVNDVTRAVVEARIANPSLSLKQIGDLFDPPVPKDAVAGRIRRLLAVARKVK